MYVFYTNLQVVISLVIVDNVKIKLTNRSGNLVIDGLGTRVWGLVKLRYLLVISVQLI